MSNKKVACIGSGVIGASWAICFALKDFEVGVYDINDEVLAKAKNIILDNLEILKENQVIDDARLSEIENHIHLTTSMKEAVEDAIFIQESAPEHYDIKWQVVEEIEKYLEKDEKERECKRNVYLQKRKAQGLMTIEQVAEWAPQYSLEIQRTIRYIGMKIIDENESVEKAHTILKIWGDALQTITSPKPSPPPALKSWLLYKWDRFKQRTDKWGLLQWYLVILGIIACVLFSSLYQNRVMDLDLTNRIFYKEVIMDEKRKERYHELDSLIHSDSFFKTYWNLGH